MSTTGIHKPVIVIGGGASGLSFAKTCTNAGKEVLLLEKTGRIGGCIESICHDDLIIECGTHTMYRSYTACYELLSPEFRAHHVFPCPTFRYFVDSVGRLTAFWRLFSAWSLFSLPKIFFTSKKGQTLSSYFTAVFGQKTYRDLFNPAFDALYCQPSAHYPLALLFKKRQRNKVKALPKSFFFRGGMSAVLADFASSVACRLDQQVVRITHDGRYYLLYTDPEAETPAYCCDTLAIAAPPTEAMRLLSGLDRFDSLPTIPMAEFSSISMIVNGSDRLSDSGVIGWKSPLFSAIFARRLPGRPSGQWGMTCHYRHADIPETEGIEMACQMLSLERDRVVSTYKKRNRLPALRVDHLPKIRQLSASLPPTLALLGNYFDGFSIEDCVRRSQQEFARLFGKTDKK